jgi:hypothetical protein
MTIGENPMKTLIAALFATLSVACYAGEITGQVFFDTGSSKRRPEIAGAEVRVYPAKVFAGYDGSRSLPAGHNELLTHTLGEGTTFGSTRPNMDSLVRYMDEEFASWDSLPKPLASTTTDTDGRFSVPHDGKEPVVIFVRVSRRHSHEKGGTTRFSFVWVAPAGKGPLVLGNDQIHSSMAKATDIFFKR